MKTTVSDFDTIECMAKKEKTVPVYARVTESDVAAVDKAAENQPIAVSRSMMVAIIIREWVKRMGKKPK